MNFVETFALKPDIKQMGAIEDLTEDDLNQVFAYTGLILLAYELVKLLIVEPIKMFYWYSTFDEGMPFQSYQEDVLFRNKNEFEACLLYLRDFMKAIDSDDVSTIQELRKQRNDLAHNIAHKLQTQEIKRDLFLLEKVNKTLFKLSNYRTYMEIGANPELKDKGIDWNSVKGHEYLVFEEVLKKIRTFAKEEK